MDDDAKKSVTPKLRFPEFREGPGWTEGQASDLVRVLQGYGFPEKHQGRQEGEFPFYKVSDISNSLERGIHLIADAAHHVNSDTVKELRAKLIPQGTTIFAKIGEAIRLNRRVQTTRASLIDNNVAGVKAIEGKASDSYVFYLWSNTPLDKYAGGVVPAISKSAIEAIPVCYPPLAEQQKIADCLTSLDEVIAAQGRKMEALAAHKNGLMQQLFPREGETLPRLRFPEFRDAGEWEPKKIGSMLEETSRPIEMDDAADYSLVTVKRRYGGVVPRERLTGREIKVKSQFIVKTNDFLISKRQIVHDACGLVPPDLDGSIVSNEYSVLGPKEGCDIVFFNYFAQQPAVSASFLQSSVGIVIEKMLFKLKTWLNCEFRFPLIAEQMRIADCLGSLDARFAAEAAKLAALEAHKKGLMQQLFP